MENDSLLESFQALFRMAVFCVLQVMKYFQKKKPNVVYEDMSYSSRRSTLVRNNNYSWDEQTPAAGTMCASTIPFQAALRAALTTWTEMAITSLLQWKEKTHFQGCFYFFNVFFFLLMYRKYSKMHAKCMDMCMQVSVKKQHLGAKCNIWAHFFAK